MPRSRHPGRRRRRHRETIREQRRRRGRQSYRSSEGGFSIVERYLARRGTYTRLSRATSADEGDWSTLAVNDVVASAATTTPEAELALLDWRSHGDGSCVEQVGHGSGVLHFDCAENYRLLKKLSFSSNEGLKTPGLCKMGKKRMCCGRELQLLGDKTSQL